ncbi:MAG TPA: hypothetical protein VL547_13435 [Dinghuibacter sp.]|uniref:hypothetical protein n=1 Tax=Dinghuibacter sp. TaxID=2024697 RepID=UPI002D0125B0|nr:hypothetical protein [Dinghuibacter sp.]HTJ13032.1 hypothetical protein [Dinghuibacter sp.]
MLQKCTAFFLLLAFAASTFSRAVIVVDFYANQDYIARNLCENRDKPMMHCCGRCLLRKRLANQDKQDKNNPERETNNKEVLFFQETSRAHFTPVFAVTKAVFHPFDDGAPIDQATGIFHPPA